MVEETKRPGSPNSNSVPEPKKIKTGGEEIPRERGIAHVKKEFIVDSRPVAIIDDDSAEAAGDRTEDAGGNGKGKGGKKGKKQRGQNKNREIKQNQEKVQLCQSLVDPDLGKVCKFGPETCRFTHDLDVYLAAKEKDIEGVCPVFNALGYCPAGLKCRFLHSHYDQETKVLIKDLVKYEEAKKTNHEINHITNDEKLSLVKKKFDFPLSDEIVRIMDSIQEDNKKKDLARKKTNNEEDSTMDQTEEVEQDPASEVQESKKENANQYIESRFFASEKKKLDLVGKKNRIAINHSG